MKKTFITTGLILISATGGWIAGRMSSGEFSAADTVAINWTEYAVAVSGHSGQAKSTEQIADSVNGSLVALTQIIGPNYGDIRSDQARRYLHKHAVALARNPDAISDTGLTLGRKAVAVDIIDCIASHRVDASAQISECSKKVLKNGKTTASPRVASAAPMAP